MNNEITEKDIIAVQEEETIDIKKLILNYIAHWKLFLLSVLLCGAVAWGYLHTATPIYNVGASVFIKDNEKSKNSMPGMMDMQNLGFFSGTNNFDNELVILQSHSIIANVIRELGLYISYEDRTNFVTRKLYKNSPVQAAFTPQEADKLSSGLRADVELKKDGSGQITVTTMIDNKEKTVVDTFEKLPYIMTTSKGAINFRPNYDKLDKDCDIRIYISNPSELATTYKANLTVAPTSKTTTIAKIDFKTSSRQLGVDFINYLVSLYNRDTNDAKNEVASKTAEFINERIKIINTELGTTEKRLENFKRSANLTDLKSDAQLALTESSQYSKLQAENSVQIQIVRALGEYLQNPDKKYDILPVNIGLADQGLSDVLKTYNELLLERKRLMRSSSESNPVIVNLNTSIESMRENVTTTIESVLRGLSITRDDLVRQEEKYRTRIQNAPGQEREYLSIARQQEIKSNLYLMLLQKREENAITLASTANNARFVDVARAGRFPVSPKGMIIYLLSIIVGIALPVAYLYIAELLSYKIVSREDVERITHAGIIGELPQSSKNESGSSIVVKENNNDIMEEAFRNLRTRLLFMMGKDKKTILVTSTTPGEGKSFVSVNLAMSLAFLGKKVLVMGLDIRKPGLNTALGISKRLEGVTNYLVSPDDEMLRDNIIQSTKCKTLYALLGGTIPPNPTELISSENLPRLIERLKSDFDYIIMDTAPVGMVTDTQIIGRLADVSLYICRSEYTAKSDFEFVNEAQLPNMSVVINGIDLNSKKSGYGYGYGKYFGGKRYGYGYGYGYGKDQKK